MTPSEQRSRYFANWEQIGRGWHTWQQPVYPEPPFLPFAPPLSYGSRDDSLTQSPTWKGAIWNKVRRGLLGDSSPTAPLKPLSRKSNPMPQTLWRDRSQIVELQIKLPKDYIPNHQALEQCLTMARIQYPLAFEIIGTDTKIITQFACDRIDKERLKAQLKAYFSEIIIKEEKQSLAEALYEDYSCLSGEYGLRQEFMRPLLMVDSKMHIDPFTGIMAVLENVEIEEVCIFQVLFQKAKYDWSPQILASVTGEPGQSFFSDAPEMLKLAELKVASPLYAVNIRLASFGQIEGRVLRNIQDLEKAVVTACQSPYNSLGLLSTPKDEFAHDADSEPYNIYQDILSRKTHRSGMLLNSKELLSLVHFPSPQIKVSKLRQDDVKTKQAPDTVIGHPCIIGTNPCPGKNTEVSLSTAHRLRHTHLIGATGTGKSTLIKRLIIQDIHAGRGVLVLDPHGDLIEDIIPFVPEHRFDDVVVIDPADSAYPIGFNLLSAHSEVEKIILSGDLVALFKRLSTSWGDQMHSVLANAILAFLEHEDGGTLLELRRFLVEPAFRKEFLANVTDSSIQYFWQHEFSMLRKDAAAPIVTRLDTFLRTRIIRNMMVQKEGLDLGTLMKEQKIILVKLAQGLIGKENSYLLGTLFVAKLNQVAQARQVIEASRRTPFYLYIDEFQNFITPSMEEILSGARKYGLGMILAHQGLAQLKNDRQVGEAVIANAGTRICFRMGDDDARTLERGFSYFEAKDLQRLEVGKAIARVGRSDHDFNLTTQMLEPVEENIRKERTTTIVKLSRAKYAKPKADVEALWQNPEIISSKPKPTTKPKNPSPKKAQPSHRNIQKTIQRIGEAHGFKSVIEEVTSNGQIDVGLSKNDLRIACEISVKNTPEYEVQSIHKRFANGYHLVVLTSPNLLHLSKIEQLADEQLPAPLRSKTHFIQLSDLDALLTKLKTAPPPPNQVRGYMVESEFLNKNTSKNTELDDTVFPNELLD